MLICVIGGLGCHLGSRRRGGCWGGGRVLSPPPAAEPPTAGAARRDGPPAYGGVGGAPSPPPRPPRLRVAVLRGDEDALVKFTSHPAVNRALGDAATGLWRRGHVRVLFALPLGVVDAVPLFATPFSVESVEEGTEVLVSTSATDAAAVDSQDRKSVV